jgi:hypothetical protein
VRRQTSQCDENGYRAIYLSVAYKWTGSNRVSNVLGIKLSGGALLGRIGEARMVGLSGSANALTLLLALAGCAASTGSTAPTTGATPNAASLYDGRYQGTGRFVSGTGCPGGSAEFPVSMNVVGGAASMPLRGGARGLFGPVSASGGLEQLRWEGDGGVIGEARGRIADGRFELDYVYDWPQANSVTCRFRYEGRRAA